MRYGLVVDVLGIAVVVSNVMIWQVAQRLKVVDPSYFKTRDGQLHWWDIHSLFCVLGMLFDRKLPNPKHGKDIRRRIVMVRVLNALGAMGGAIFLCITFAHPELIFAK
ncbi:hypothetical protein [Dyella silvae]|uniref:hypothetical protein n=1 Tax=Dyella silvae TaxID=2994424 RepID=UPI002264A1FA|nr:hypothetical protein [Dyella silvae]